MQIRLYRNLWIWNINIARENRFVVFEQQETRKYIYRLLRITRINSLSPFGSSINYPLWRAFSMIRTPKSLLGHRFHTMIVILAIWASLSFHHIFLDDRYGSKGFDRSLKITILYENCLICYKKQNLYYYLNFAVEYYISKWQNNDDSQNKLYQRLNDINDYFMNLITCLYLRKYLGLFHLILWGKL